MNLDLLQSFGSRVRRQECGASRPERADQPPKLQRDLAAGGLPTLGTPWFQTWPCRHKPISVGQAAPPWSGTPIPVAALFDQGTPVPLRRFLTDPMVATA
jgi:hypothetical protein